MSTGASASEAIRVCTICCRTPRMSSVRSASRSSGCSAGAVGVQQQGRRRVPDVQHGAVGGDGGQAGAVGAIGDEGRFGHPASLRPGTDEPSPLPPRWGQTATEDRDKRRLAAEVVHRRPASAVAPSAGLLEGSVAMTGVPQQPRVILRSTVLPAGFSDGYLRRARRSGAIVAVLARCLPQQR